ncbi:SAF domain-containing protein [Mycobacterium sp.]|uniref:SAF domain-containing protein n=1 Tax=Mycobacterium sp. TaxID=1785 RepID=UPI003A860C48
MRESSSLDPTLFDRVSTALRPDWARTVLARRVAAGGLVALAIIAGLRSNSRSDQVDVVVAIRDLSTGTELTDADVAYEKRLATTVPNGAHRQLDAVVGSVLAGPARRGEILTDVRLLGSRLAESTAGPGARLVPLHLADNALAELLRVGDVVDVLARPASDSPPGSRPTGKMIATGATVVLISNRPRTPAGTDSQVVLVAVPAGLATALAGAALGQTVSLVLH